MENKRKLVVIVVLALACVGIAAAAMLMESGEAVPHHPPLNPPQAQGEEPMAAEAVTPADAVSDLLRSAREWDLMAITRWSTPTSDSIFTDAYRGVLVPAITRLEYNTRVERITGSSAIVEVSVYAVDLALALGDLTSSAESYIAHLTVEGTQPDWPAFIAEHISRLETDVGSLIRVMRTAPVHLVEDNGGNWLFEAGNPENRGFYNAVSGGLLDIIDSLEQLSPDSQTQPPSPPPAEQPAQEEQPTPGASGAAYGE